MHNLVRTPSPGVHKTNDAAFSGIFGLMKPDKHTMLAQVEANQKGRAALLRTSFGLLD
jgi:hypothetical protein